MLLAALLAVTLATEPSAASRPIRVYAFQFNAVTVDVLTAQLVAARLQTALLAEGLLLQREQDAAAPPDCARDSAACSKALRAQGMDVVLIGSVVFNGATWELNARAVDTHTGQSLAVLNERATTQAGLEQRIDLGAPAMAASIRRDLGSVRQQPDELIGRNIVSIAPAALFVGGLYIEYERVLSDQLTLTASPGLQLAIPALGTGNAPVLSFEGSARWHPFHPAPRGFWISPAVRISKPVAAEEAQLAGTVLLGYTAILTPRWQVIVGFGGGVVMGLQSRDWGNLLNGRLHVGYAF